MKKKDIYIGLTITIFLLCIFAIWKLVRIPAIESKVEELYFSDRSYAKKMIIESYLSSPSQIEHIFTTNSFQNQERSFTNANDKEDHSLYLIIHLKNTGDKMPWGTLECKTSEGHKCEIHVGMINNNYEIYVIPTCYTINNPPLVKPLVKWKKLYTYK